MEDYPSNSKNPKPKNSQGENSPKVEKVANGRRRKKSIFAKAVDTVAGDDMKNIASYLWGDILVPAAKNMLFDMIRDGAEMRIFGSVRGSRGRDGRSGTYISYDQVGRDRRDRRDVREPVRRSNRPDEILLDTRAEAEEVISRMYDLFETYQIVSLADYYDLVGATSEFTDNKWGWDNLKGIRILRVRDGYIIDLPKMIALN